MKDNIHNSKYIVSEVVTLFKMQRKRVKTMAAIMLDSLVFKYIIYDIAPLSPIT